MAIQKLENRKPLQKRVCEVKKLRVATHGKARSAGFHCGGCATQCGSCYTTCNYR